MRTILTSALVFSVLLMNAQTLVSISVIPKNPTLGKGTFQRFKAIGLYSDNSNLDISNSVTWSSSNSSVATISNSLGNQGYETSVELGNSTIYAVQGAVFASTNLNIIGDADGDAVPDTNDNCVFINNPFQEDTDNDGIGNSCDCAISTANPGDIYATSPAIISVPNGISTGVSNTFYSVLKGGKMNIYNLTPNYQWTKNGLNVGTNSSTYSDNSLMTGDVIKLIISSGSTCAAGNLESNSITTSTLLAVDITKNHINIYPNPAKDKISVTNLQNITSFKIYNSEGRLVKANASISNTIDISILVKGNYYLEIITPLKTYKSKFIKN